MEVPKELIRIAEVIGENEDGMTLFVPKDLQGTFTLRGGERFLSFMFVKRDDDGSMMIWIPWEESEDNAHDDG